MAESTTLARPYASAAFDTAYASNKLGLWDDYLQSMATLTAHEKVKQLLVSPSLTALQKSAVFSRLMGEDVEQSVKNFIDVLADNKRLLLLPDIQQLFAELKALAEQTLSVDVISAYEVSESEQQRLAFTLKEKTQRDVTVTLQTDSSLIGGAILRVGDTVIDGSVKGRLAKLSESMTA